MKITPWLLIAVFLVACYKMTDNLPPCNQDPNCVDNPDYRIVITDHDAGRD